MKAKCPFCEAEASSVDDKINRSTPLLCGKCFKSFSVTEGIAKAKGISLTLEEKRIIDPEKVILKCPICTSEISFLNNGQDGSTQIICDCSLCRHPLKVNVLNGTASVSVVQSSSSLAKESPTRLCEAETQGLVENKRAPQVSQTMKFKGQFVDVPFAKVANGRWFEATLEANDILDLERILAEKAWTPSYYYRLDEYRRGEDFGKRDEAKRIVWMPTKRREISKKDANWSSWTGNGGHKDLVALIKNEKNLELENYIGEALAFYEDAEYARAHHCFWNVLRRVPASEPYIFYYMRVCQRVLMEPLGSDDIKYLKVRQKNQRAGNWLAGIQEMFLEDRRRCKWCGRFIRYIPPMNCFTSNECVWCRREYPMPTVSWDSPEGRAIRYYGGPGSEYFLKEFEMDYEPAPDETK